MEIELPQKITRRTHEPRVEILTPGEVDICMAPDANFNAKCWNDGEEGDLTSNFASRDQHNYTTSCRMLSAAARTL